MRLTFIRPPKSLPPIGAGIARAGRASLSHEATEHQPVHATQDSVSVFAN
ncbi:hypothetical protein OG729_13800 [Streptomyces sp. NBC_00210]